MSKVLFASSYFYKLDPKQWKFRQPYPPLGTLQAAAVIRAEGIPVALFDAGLSDGPSSIQETLVREQPAYVVIYDDGFNYLTKMCLTIMREAVFRMMSLAKQQGCHVIVNSSDATDHVEQYLSHGADYIIRGEGETTLKELLRCLEQGADVNTIPGLSFLNDDGIVNTPPRALQKDLDEYPVPAWDLAAIAAYRSIWKKHHGYFSLNIATTRGCPYKCNWCAKPIYGNRYTSRSPQHVVNEIQYLLTQFQPDHFWMSDDIFGLKPGWIEEFNQRIQERQLTFRYKIQSRADLMNEATVKSLAESGCDTVWLGAESGSQKILDAMDKGITVEDIHHANHLLKKYDIKPAFFLQFGYLNETKQDIDATLNMVLKELPHEIGISISYPLPGTKFHDAVKNMLREKKNWTDSDDLAMLYEAPFPAAYYRILQRYVHSRFRIQRGIYFIHGFMSRPTISPEGIRKLASLIYHIPVSLLQLYRLKRLSIPA